MAKRHSSKISFVICTHNRREALEKYSLPSILKTKYPNLELVVVDDASDDGTVELMKSFCRNNTCVQHIHMGNRKGSCLARNLGARRASGDLVVFVDDDVVVDKKYPFELNKIYAKNPNLAGLCGITFYPNSKKVQCYGYPRGCNMSVRKSVFNAFNFDKNLFFNKNPDCDDWDFFHRIMNHGHKIGYSKKIKAWHYELPGEHKTGNRRSLGGTLNYLYCKLKIKWGSLGEYYSAILLGFLALVINKKKLDELRATKYKTFAEASKIYNWFKIFVENKQMIKIPQFIFILLVEIPIKAKSRHIFEEIKYLKNKSKL